MTTAIGWIRGSIHSAKLLAGMLIYAVSGKTPGFAHQSMIYLFCLTKGHSNDWLSRVIALFKRPYRFASASGVLGDMSKRTQRDPVVSALRDRGYYVLERGLPKPLCERLLQYATSHPCKMRRMDGGPTDQPSATIYRRGAPRAVRYDFDTQDLLENEDVQRVLADFSFVAIAQDYFGSRPVVDVLSMWWHTAFSDKPDAEAAQYYHFDMDRPKWLKVFIYLTDVETSNGPHSFVAGSHRSGAIPSSLLSKGYARLTDEEIAREFDRKEIVEFAAPRGTIIVEDTRGLHKGKHVEKGDRLILQIQYSNSLFGARYPKVRLKKDLCSELRETIARYGGMYAAYL